MQFMPQFRTDINSLAAHLHHNDNTMEGLIPMVYKSIKKSTTRRHYQHLGSGATPARSYDIADFYANGDQDYMTAMNGQYAAADHEKVLSEHGFSNMKGHQEFHHRRYKSFSVDYGGSFSPGNRTGTAQSKKLVRFRSHRFFSCVTGA